MRTTLLFSLFLIGILNSIGQNLVKNPSFENTKECAHTLDMIQGNVENWTKGNLATPDLFNACFKEGKENVGLINNFAGSQQAKSGQNYIGFIVLKDGGNYREYIQGELIDTLEQHRKYRLSFYISSAESYNYSIKDLGVVFLEKPIIVPTNKIITKPDIQRYSKKLHYKEINSDTFWDDQENWQKVTLEFIAEGYETFFVIGNFRATNGTEKKAKPGEFEKKGYAYYFLDMVEMIPLEKIEPEPEPEVEEIAIEIDTKYTLKDVLFETNKATLVEDSLKELEKLAAYLKRHPEFKIEIHGHTDNVGSLLFNHNLSIDRAKAVAQYFISKEIEEERIKTKGYGNSRPVASNETEEGRAKNRRVEFFIRKK
ncbi:OmpA family protein [Aureivirga sp. CE67]|uniref:OmpA family protein n=1 Tax=Aureivirga sp. CE67 TaxID=1788983 RepID=UPI0018CA9DEA|nr:OmpA family protein [Aureivirga sp. CE67]